MVQNSKTIQNRKKTESKVGSLVAGNQNARIITALKQSSLNHWEAWMLKNLMTRLWALII